MKLFRSAAVGLGALAAISTAAWAAGYFPYFPVVGGSAYCSSASGTGSGTGSSTFPSSGPGSSFGQGSVGQSGVFTLTCNDQVPAGPAGLTGNEFIPADTALPSGQQPQTVLIPTSLLMSGGSSLVVTTNASLTIPNGVSSLISNQGAATIALITMPAAPWNGQYIEIANAGSGVLTLTSIAANTGQTIVQGAAPASLAIQTNNAAAASLSSVVYRYQTSNTTWYRVQ